MDKCNHCDKCDARMLVVHLLDKNEKNIKLCTRCLILFANSTVKDMTVEEIKKFNG